MNQKIGHDYGIKPKMILLGDMSFMESFQEAKCIGMAYAYTIDENEKYSFQLFFMFENEKPASLFLDSILRWCEQSETHDDAVGIDFIGKQNGEYTLAIYNKMDNLIKRMIPKEIVSKVSPVVFHAIHFKEIDTSESFKLFKNKYIEGDSVHIGYLIGTKSGMRLQGKKYFTKKNFGFYNDTDVKEEVFSLSAYQRLKSKDESTMLPQPLKEQSVEEIEGDRMKEIKLYFPLTYNKLTNTNWLIEIRDTLSIKYSTSYIFQAICNLILAERLKTEPNLDMNFFNRSQSINILQYLNNNYESFRSFFPDDRFFTKYKIEAQINRDKKELIKNKNKK